MSKHNANPADYGWTYHGANQHSPWSFTSATATRPAGLARARVLCRPTRPRAAGCAVAGTVNTNMQHPSQGPTQLFRRVLSDAGFEAVLDNPNSHTGVGYHTKVGSMRVGSTQADTARMQQGMQCNTCPARPVLLPARLVVSPLRPVPACCDACLPACLCSSASASAAANTHTSQASPYYKGGGKR